MEKFYKRTILFFVFLLFLMTITTFCLIWQHQQMLSMGYRLATLCAKKEELLRERGKLLVLFERLKAPARIEELAEKMALIRPANPKIVYIEENYANR